MCLSIMTCHRRPFKDAIVRIFSLEALPYRLFRGYAIKKSLQRTCRPLVAKVSENSVFCS